MRRVGAGRRDNDRRACRIPDRTTGAHHGAPSAILATGPRRLPRRLPKTSTQDILPQTRTAWTRVPPTRSARSMTFQASGRS
ncbi:hypothetical protein ACSTH6_00275, partial [Vibrio parahaemolyticus]